MWVSEWMWTVGLHIDEDKKTGGRLALGRQRINALVEASRVRLGAMSDQSNEHASICEIMGCSGEGTTTRWIITEDHGKRELRVCRKHEEGDLDPGKIPAGA